jgi:hypothetical protein
MPLGIGKGQRRAALRGGLITIHVEQENRAKHAWFVVPQHGSSTSSSWNACRVLGARIPPMHRPAPTLTELHTEPRPGPGTSPVSLCAASGVVLPVTNSSGEPFVRTRSGSAAVPRAVDVPTQAPPVPGWFTRRLF